MNIKSEINQLQKQLLVRLNVRKGSTLFTIIQEISRQAYATSSLVVSQKNSTLAKKCNVTPSTISRNLKKLKEKCIDLVTIEQNRNTEERFASLVFTFIPQQMSNDLSNGNQTECVNDSKEQDKKAKFNSSLTTDYLVLCKNNNKDYNTDTVNKVEQEKIIFDTYMNFKEKGIDKTLFNKVLMEVKNKRGVNNLGAYLRGALNIVAGHIDKKDKSNGFMEFYDHLIAQESRNVIRPVPFYNWLDE